MNANIAMRTDHAVTGRPGSLIIGVLVRWSSLAVARAKLAGSSWQWGDPRAEGLIVERAWIESPDDAGLPSYRVLWAPATEACDGPRVCAVESWCSEYDLTPADVWQKEQQLPLFGATPLLQRLQQRSWPNPEAYPRRWSAVDAAAWAGADLDPEILIGSEAWRRHVLFRSIGAGAPAHERTWSMQLSDDLQECRWQHPHVPVDLCLVEDHGGWEVSLHRDGLRPFVYGVSPDLLAACRYASTLLWEGLL